MCKTKEETDLSGMRFEFFVFVSFPKVSHSARVQLHQTVYLPKYTDTHENCNPQQVCILLRHPSGAL
jgi:hypothetical protein